MPLGIEQHFSSLLGYINGSFYFCSRQQTEVNLPTKASWKKDERHGKPCGATLLHARRVTFYSSIHINLLGRTLCVGKGSHTERYTLSLHLCMAELAP